MIKNQSFSIAQLRVIRQEGVTLVGVDSARRPVVEGLSGIPQQLRRWALLRNGDPTDVREPVDRIYK